MERMAGDDVTASSADVVDRIFSFDDSLSRSSKRLFTDDDVAAMIAEDSGNKGTLFPASSFSETPREEWKRSETCPRGRDREGFCSPREGKTAVTDRCGRV